MNKNRTRKSAVQGTTDTAAPECAQFSLYSKQIGLFAAELRPNNDVDISVLDLWPLFKPPKCSGLTFYLPFFLLFYVFSNAQELWWWQTRKRGLIEWFAYCFMCSLLLVRHGTVDRPSVVKTLVHHSPKAFLCKVAATVKRLVTLCVCVWSGVLSR